MRSERRYELLEKSRHERHRTVRRALRDTTQLPGMPSRRVLIGLLVAGVGLTLLVTLNQPVAKPLGLAKSCTTPAVALSSVTTGAGSSVRYAVTGPAAGTYIITVDAKTARVQGDGAVVTPTGAVAVAVHQGLKGCLAGGTVPSTVSTDAQEVELFRDGRQVAAKKLPN